MRFELCQGWRITFRDSREHGAYFRALTFADPAKIEELVARSESRLMLEDRNAFELGLRNGLGAVTLTLTEEQYRKLLR